MKAKKYFLIFLFISFCFADCKKYPEGPAFSLCPKTWRLSGTWEVEAFLINGSDSLSQLTCTSYLIRLESDSKRVTSLCPSTGGGSGVWQFNNRAKELNLNLDITAGAKTPFPITNANNNYSNLNWEIQRLTRKELWLKKNYNGKEYYIKFKAIKKDFP